MRTLTKFLPLIFISALHGCSVNEPSDSDLRGSAALAEHDVGEMLDLKKYEKSELSNKKCIISSDEKIANCTFKLNDKLYNLKFGSSGSGWSYAGNLR